MERLQADKGVREELREQADSREPERRSLLPEDSHLQVHRAVVLDSALRAALSRSPDAKCPSLQRKVSRLYVIWDAATAARFLCSRRPLCLRRLPKRLRLPQLMAAQLLLLAPLELLAVRQFAHNDAQRVPGIRKRAKYSRR